MFNFFKNKAVEKKNKLADTTKKLVGVEDRKKNWNYISYMSSKVFSFKKEDLEVRKTFSQEMKDKNLTQEDLNQIYNSYSLTFYIFFIFSILCLISAIYSGFVQLSFVSFTFGIGVFLICLMNMLRYSLYAFKIKHKKFCNLQDWWNNPQDWFPKMTFFKK